MKYLVLLSLAIGAWAQDARPAAPQILGPYFSDAFNFPADLTGTPDTRPTTWGLAGSVSASVVFSPPAGYRVRVLRVDGNYMAGSHGALLPDGSRAVYLPGNRAYTSWGIKTTAPGSSSRVTLAADNCFAWLEYAISNGEVNQPFGFDTSAGGLLEADNTFLFVSAVYLNDQPISIHMETTFILKFQFERELAGTFRSRPLYVDLEKGLNHQ